MSSMAAFRMLPVLVGLLLATAQSRTVYVTTGGNDAADGLSWATAKQTVQAGLNAAASGDQVWTAAGTYVQCITLKDGVALYGGFAGSETDLSQRDWRTNVTILDGNQGGSVVTAPTGAAATTRIDGFTIRNGRSSSRGGGIYCYSSSPTITNNIITGNTATSYGGGIYCNSSSSPTITNNTITGNTASSGGGGIYCESSSLMIANNTISGNTAGSYGGGIYCYSATIASNTITCNTASSGGGGIYCSFPTITNTIIAFNSSGISGYSGTTLRCCCAYGNGAYNYSGLTDPTGTNGNISADPQLADVAKGNVHLQPTSPCLNAGDDTAVQAGWADIDGQTRVQGTHVDIGADESDGTVWPSTAVIICVSLSGSDSNDGLSWVSAKKTVQAGLNAASSGDQVWVAAGTYVERITLKRGAALYGGFAGSETDLSQRNWQTNVTILDGNQAGSVVTAPTGATATTRIDGFTIRNGKASFGGGIYCYSSSPTIANNTITGNTASSSGGGGIYCSSSSFPIVANNTISGNTAGYNGGGIYCSSSSSPTITNNTITGNTASYGGGIYCSSSSPKIANTIIAFNSSGVYSSAGTPTLRYCCAYGNGAYNYSGLTDPTGTNGNISADPQLANVPWSNVHLQPTSPCLNAGDDTVVQAGWTDIDGQARVQGMHVDIGADESDGTTWPSAAAIIYVSPSGSDSNDGLSWVSAKRTVQAALDAGGVGSQIWVAAGTYVGTIRLGYGMALYGGFAGSETDLSQRNWQTNVTILDGNRAGSVVTAPPAATASTQIDGFTIRNGSATYGAGLRLLHSSPTIRNNIITANIGAVNGKGAGLYLSNSSAQIANNAIIGNSTTSGSALGGGLYLERSTPTIANNIITRNVAGEWGGGLYVDMSSSPTIINNTIVGNVVLGAPLTGSGGGLYMNNSSGMLVSNIIAGNSVIEPSLSTGGGLALYGSSPTIANNTIAGNNAASGGGISVGSSSSPMIVNTVIAFNSSGVRSGADSAATLRACCVYGNVDYNFSGLPDPTGSNGNIQIDPRFADVVYGNYHIQPDSLCKDAGDDLDVQAGWLDMDGQPRRIGPVDIGADESDSTAWAQGPYVVVRVSTTGNDVYDGSSWALAKRTVQAGIDAAAAKGGEVWVAKGTYYEKIALQALADVYGGFAGTEMQREQRDQMANVTVLDGNQSGSVVTGLGIVTRSSVLDGFTIRNGKAIKGGGVYLAKSSSTISNNIITANSTDDNGRGGGLYVQGSAATIRNNTISGNIASGNGGGGLYLLNFSGTIANNVVAGNTYHGLYMSSFSSSSSSIVNNTIMGNTLTGLYISSSSPIVANNVIASNSGRGLQLYASSSPIIVNNTIIGNIDKAEGSGVYLGPSCSPTIANTIIAFNSSGLCQSDISGSPTLRYNCVYGNGAYDFSGLNDVTGVNGNIQVDPGLADLVHRNTNFHIRADSPCRDAGNDADVQAGWVDLDGQPRRVGRVDIGADESDGTAWTPAADVIVRVSPAGDDAHDGSSWALAKRTVQAGINAASVSGGQVWVARGTYYERIVLQPYAHVYGGFFGIEARQDQRDWVSNETVLDGSQGGSVVTATSIAPGLSTLNGFTVRNGNAATGGGLYLSNYHGTIASNIVTDNCASSSAGGLWLANSSPTVVGNTIRRNSAVAGGGLYLNSSSPMIANNMICSNNTTSSGGGLTLVFSSPRISNNVIAGNSVSGTSGYGSGLTVVSSSPKITNNLIVRNMAYSSSGSGLYLESSSPTIANTIMAFNSSGIRRYGASGTVTLLYNCVYGNTGYNYSGLTDPTGSNGNLSVNPLFVRSPAIGADGVWGTADDDPGDLHLMAGSACINAGDPAYVPAAGETDMDDQPRVIGARVDIGADEFAWPGDANADGYVNVGDLQVLVAAWGSQASPSSGNWDARADVNGDGYVSVGDLQALVVNWGRTLN